MSETPVYFILVQLNSLMTGSLRLSLALLAMSLLACLLSLRVSSWLPLTRYFSALGLGAAAVGLVAALCEKGMLPYENPFVNQGVWFAVGLLLGAGLLLGLQSLKSFEIKALRLMLGLIGSLGLGACFWLPSFSRSDKVLISTLMIWPMAVALAYFPLLLAGVRHRGLFHLLWLPGAGIGLLLHYLWLYPMLAGIPKEGEFYPFINLYDWFLFLAVILYLGNLYIDYWLRQRDQRSILTLGWNYLVVVAAILCLWLNANVFDTLAL